MFLDQAAAFSLPADAVDLIAEAWLACEPLVDLARRHGSALTSRGFCFKAQRNGSGAVFETVFPLLNPFARIPVCGLISMYNASSASPGLILLPHLMRAILTKRKQAEGQADPTFVFVGPKGYPFPMQADEKFRKTFCDLWNKIYSEVN